MTETKSNNVFQEKSMCDDKKPQVDTRASDAESGSVIDTTDVRENGYVIDSNGTLKLKNGLKPGLKNRMINLMAICGILGPGTFVGMGSMLRTGGGAGMLVGFAIVALLVISMMFSVGELNATLDFNFCKHASRYVSPGFGGSMALAYVVLWITNLIAEYTSLSSICMTYTDKVPFYGWYLIFWGFFTSFQFLGVTAYGEAEYVLGFMKLFFIAGFYIFAIVYASGGVPNHKPGNPFGETPLVEGFKGIANSFVYAAILLSGIESVSVFASEARNPSKAIPVAVRNTMFRIFFVYFGLSIFYAITVSPNDPALGGASKTLRAPMTIALTNAGWVNARYFVTTIIVLTCISSINSAIFLSSRSLLTWAEMGMGPKIFTKTDKKGVPWVAVHTCHLFSFLCLLSMSSGSSVAYSYIVNVTSVAAFIVWTGISFTHLRFRKGWELQKKPLDGLGFVAPWYPWSNYFAIGLGIVLVLVQGWSSFDPWDASTFVDAYILLPVFFVVWAGYDFLYLKTRVIKYADMDFETGKRLDVDDALNKYQITSLTSALSH